MKKKTLSDVKVAGKRVLMRVDYNVPQDKSGAITDDLRIKATLPAVKEILSKGGRLILMSHLGRPKKREPEFSMAVTAKRLSELIGKPVKMAQGCTEPEVVAMAKALKDGEVMVLENLRYYKGEQDADESFGKGLAALGEIYVGDAFGTAHRGDASMAVTPKMMPVAVAGPLMALEIDAFAKVLESPARPFVAILGGAKVSDKVPVIENLIGKVNTILIGGGMAYTFLKARGVGVGASKLEADLVETAAKIMDKAKKAGVEILLPSDHKVAKSFANDAESKTVEGAVPEGWMGLDVGPKTAEAFSKKVATAGSVVWNGPMGVFEFDNFAAGTKKVAAAMAAAKGFTVVGGGDTAAAVEKFDYASKMKHVSTGGGASLALLAGEPMPGIEALNNA